MQRQLINSSPARKKVGSYITKSGETKNRYVRDKNVKVVKAIFHNDDHIKFK